MPFPAFPGISDFQVTQKYPTFGKKKTWYYWLTFIFDAFFHLHKSKK